MYCTKLKCGIYVRLHYAPSRYQVFHEFYCEARTMKEDSDTKNSLTNRTKYMQEIETGIS